MVIETSAVMSLNSALCWLFALNLPSSVFDVASCDTSGKEKLLRNLSPWVSVQRGAKRLMDKQVVQVLICDGLVLFTSTRCTRAASGGRWGGQFLVRGWYLFRSKAPAAQVDADLNMV